MPGEVVKAGARKHPPGDDPEELKEYTRREVFQLLFELNWAINSAVREVTGDYSVEVGDELLVIDASDGDVAITLPPAVRYFRRLVLKRIDDSSNEVTISPVGDETIEGEESITLDGQWSGTELTPSSDTAWVQASYSSAGRSLRPEVFDLSDTAITLEKKHKFNYIRTTAGSAVTLTVEDDDSSFQVGDWVRLFQAGAGALTLAAGSGVTLNKPETLEFYKQHSSGIITKSASKTWDVDIDAVLA